MIDMKKYAIYAPRLVRIAIGLVFLWFGFTQLFTDNLLGYVPQWVNTLPISVGAFMRLNGAFEVIFGVLLLAGFFTRIVALLLSIHLLGIALNVGYNDVMIRDLGLTLVTISILLHGPDEWTLDHRRKAKKEAMGAKPTPTEAPKPEAAEVPAAKTE